MVSRHQNPEFMNNPENIFTHVARMDIVKAENNSEKLL